MTQIILLTSNELDTIIQNSIRKAIEELPEKSERQENQFLTIKQASDYLSLATQTIYGLTSKRLIPYIKKGKKLYFKKSELENWLNNGKQKSREEILEALKGGKP